MQVLIDYHKDLKGFDCTEVFHECYKTRVGVLVTVPFEMNSEFISKIQQKGLKVIDVKVSD